MYQYYGPVPSLEMEQKSRKYDVVHVVMTVNLFSIFTLGATVSNLVDSESIVIVRQCFQRIEFNSKIHTEPHNLHITAELELQLWMAGCSSSSLEPPADGAGVFDTVHRDAAAILGFEIILTAKNC